MWRRLLIVCKLNTAKLWGNRAADQVHSMVPWWKQNLTDKNGVRSFCYIQNQRKMVWEHRTWEDIRRATFLEIPEKQRITPKHCEHLSKCITAKKGLKDGPSICEIAPKIIPSPQVGLSLKIVPETHLPMSYTLEHPRQQEKVLRERNQALQVFIFLLMSTLARTIYYHLTCP